MLKIWYDRRFRSVRSTDIRRMRESRLARLHGILQAGSPQLSDISHAMEGTSPNANNKSLNRFLNTVNPWMPLMRLFDEDASFVVGDVTEDDVIPIELTIPRAFINVKFIQMTVWLRSTAAVDHRIGARYHHIAFIKAGE